MSKYLDRTPPNADTLMRRLQALESEVRELRAARRLEASTIGRGGITVQGGAIILRDAQGNEIARMGVREDLQPEPDGDLQPGFILRRNDGSVAFTLDDPNPNAGGYRQLIKMQDAQGNIIFSEDFVSGWGLATPTMSLPVFPVWDSSAWPGTTSTSFSGIWLGYAPAWNPYIEIGVRGTTSGTDGTTGQVRLLMNGVTIGDPLNVVNGSYSDKNWRVAVPSLQSGFRPGATVQILIEGRRTNAGGGKVQVTPTWIYGTGSDPIV